VTLFRETRWKSRQQDRRGMSRLSDGLVPGPGSGASSPADHLILGGEMQRLALERRHFQEGTAWRLFQRDPGRVV